MVGSRITKRARQDIGGWHGERNLLCLVRPATDCAAFFKANHQSSGKLINRELMSNLRVCVCVLCVCWVSSVRRCTHQLEDNWRIAIFSLSIYRSKWIYSVVYHLPSRVSITMSAMWSPSSLHPLISERCHWSTDALYDLIKLSALKDKRGIATEYVMGWFRGGLSAGRSFVTNVWHIQTLSLMCCLT